MKVTFIIGVSLLISGSFGARKVRLHRERTAEDELSIQTIASESARYGHSERVKRASGLADEVISRVQQMYKGFKVWGGEMVKDLTSPKNFELSSTNGGRNVQAGTFYLDLDDDLVGFDTSEFSGKKDVEVKHTLKKKDSILMWAIERSEPIIYVDPDTNKAIKAYHVDLEFPLDISSRPQRIVGVDGRTYRKWNAVMTGPLPLPYKVHKSGTGPGGNGRTGWYRFGEKYDKLEVKKGPLGLTCYLENKYISTKHNLFQFFLQMVLPHSFPCNENNLGVNPYGAYSPLNDAHYFGTQFFDMFNDWYDMEPNVGALPVDFLVHFGVLFPNAGYNSLAHIIFFGDGDFISYYPFSTMGITIHELAHAITDHYSKLEYSGESGGLNEAFSDMTAAAFEYYNDGKTKYKIGDKAAKSGELRCMDDPPCDGESIDHVKDMTKSLDVHYSSGVFNKVFYLLSESLHRGVRDAFDIMFTANMKKWSKHTDFVEAGELVMDVTEELIAGRYWEGPHTWLDSTTVAEALSVVGIDCTVRNGTTTWDCSD